MSTARQALKRLEPSDQRGIASLAREAARHGGDEARAREPAIAVGPALVGRTDRRGADAFAGLLERLRALGEPSDAARVLVFAAVTDGGPARAVVDGLVCRAQELVMRIGVGELARVGGRALLGDRDGAVRRLVELDAGGLRSAVADWLEPLGRPPFVLIEAPSVAASADAVLLASACDGLVLVAQTGVTPRAALRAAIERAQVAGCRTLGVVLTTTSTA